MGMYGFICEYTYALQQSDAMPHSASAFPLLFRAPHIDGGTGTLTGLLERRDIARILASLSLMIGGSMSVGLNLVGNILSAQGMSTVEFYVLTAGDGLGRF